MWHHLRCVDVKSGPEQVDKTLEKDCRDKGVQAIRNGKPHRPVSVLRLPAVSLRPGTRYSDRITLYRDRLCGLVVRVPGYRFRGPGSILGTTRFAET
jgi:hypothetical protein